MVTVEQARQVLKEAGYAVANLWHIDDVKSRFECSDKDALALMNEVLENDATIEHINEAIVIVGEIWEEEGDDLKRI